MSTLNRVLAPAAKELRDAPILEDWYAYPARPGVEVLVGRVTGHPRVPDGPVTTSAVVAYDSAAGWARTRNRVYKLGAAYVPKPPSIGEGATGPDVQVDMPRLPEVRPGELPDPNDE